MPATEPLSTTGSTSPHLASRGAPRKADGQPLFGDGFPYSVRYVLSGEEIRVLAVSHDRRKEDYLPQEAEGEAVKDETRGEDFEP